MNMLLSSVRLVGIVGALIPLSVRASISIPDILPDLSPPAECIGAREFAKNCTEGALLDPIEQSELMGHVGSNVHVTNENGCWFHGKVIDVAGQLGIDTTDREEIQCPDVSGTILNICLGDCPFTIDLSGRRYLKKGTETKALSLQPGDDKYQQYVEHCGDQEYKASLVIERTHFYAVATPVMAGTTCPSFVTSAVLDEQHQLPSAAGYRKELLAVEDVEWTIFGRKQEDQDEKSFPIGAYPLLELVHAHESVDPHKSSSSDALDIIRLNCADFMLALASALNFKIDAKLTTFVARRLLQDSGKELASKIRSSVHFLSIFGSGNDGGRNLLRRDQQEQDTNDDTQVLQALVEQRLLAAGVDDLDTASVFAAAAVDIAGE